MTSITHRGKRAKTARASVAALLGVGLLCTTHGSAQEGADLAELVFEPVPLSSARSAPLDLAEPAAKDGRALLAAVDRHSAAVESLRRAGAANSDLVEQLGLLAIAYQDVDRHEDAHAALDEAIALTVESDGADNLEQIPLQEQKIASYIATGDFASVDDTEELIYSLYERNHEPADREMYVATTNLADWNLTAYYRENYAPGSRALVRQRTVLPRAQRCIATQAVTNSDGSISCAGNSIFSGDVKDVADQDVNDIRLRRVDRLYADYQEAVIDAGFGQLDIAVDLAKRIAGLAYATKQEMDFERDNYFYDRDYDGSREQAARNSPRRLEESFESGESALEYAIRVLRSVDGVRADALAAAFLDLGDWRLAYGKAAGAEKAYGEAYDVLLEAGFSAANIDIALATALPLRIPVFATHVHTRRSLGKQPDAELDFRGYVDVSYTVDGLGNARDVRVLGGSADDAARIESLLERRLRSVKLRPVLTGAALVSPGRVEARYYYAY